MENMQSIESECLSSANICCIWHFLTLVGEVYVLLQSWRKFATFLLIPQQSFFSPPLKHLYISFAPITSHYGYENQTTFGFCLFFLFFFLLYQPLCPVHSLQVPGIPLATGKQQDCLLYLVTIATGLECEAVMVALHCAEGRPLAVGCCWVCGCQSRHVSGDLCCLPIALIVSTAG